MARVFDVELETLLEASGVPSMRSVHLLLYQRGARWRSPLEAARRLFAGQVDAWIEVADPRSPGDASLPKDVLVRKRQRLGRMRTASMILESPRALARLSSGRNQPRRSTVTSRLGIIFGATSAVLRSIENPSTVLDGETTWEHDVAAAFRARDGVEPAANVCVYRESDLQELGAHLDPLATALRLIRTHPHVAVEDGNGRITTGAAAIETIVEAARPAGISSETWQLLARAAGVGLARAMTSMSSGSTGSPVQATQSLSKGYASW